MRFWQRASKSPSSTSIDTLLAESEISASTSTGTDTTHTRENVETYCSLAYEEIHPGVVALSSGFMTYAPDIHPEYSRVRRELEQHPHTFVLLPSCDREVCVAETVRRQIARPFGRSSAKEEAVIRARFAIYNSLPVGKIETMRPPAAVVAEIVAVLSLQNECGA